MCSYAFSKGNEYGLKLWVDQVVGHCTLGRGESSRKIMLGDLGVVDISGLEQGMDTLHLHFQSRRKRKSHANVRNLN